MTDQLPLFDTPTVDGVEAYHQWSARWGPVPTERVKRPVREVSIDASHSGHIAVVVSRLDRRRVYLALVGSGRSMHLLRRAQLMQRMLLANI